MGRALQLLKAQKRMWASSFSSLDPLCSNSQIHTVSKCLTFYVDIVGYVTVNVKKLGDNWMCINILDVCSLTVFDVKKQKKQTQIYLFDL